MTKSRGLRDRRNGGEDPVVAQEGPQGSGPSPVQGDDGLDVCAALAALLQAEVPVRPVADDAGLGGRVEHPAQAAAVALRSVQVPNPTPRVARDGHEPGSRGQVARVHIGRDVAGSNDELSSEYRAHARQGLDDLRLWMAAERLADLLVDPLEPLIEGEDPFRQVGHDLRDDILSGQRALLGCSGFQRSRGVRVGAPDTAVGRSRGEPGPAAAADGGRSLVARQQDERALWPL